MSGQFLVEREPELEPELELEPEPADELEEPESVLPAPDPDDGAVVDWLAVEELDVELVPVFPEPPDVVDVVAASATNAPPAMRPDVSAPVARTLRRRICMGMPFLFGAGPFEPVLLGCAPDLSAAAEGHWWMPGVVRRMDDGSQQRRRRCNRRTGAA